MDEQHPGDGRSGRRLAGGAAWPPEDAAVSYTHLAADGHTTVEDVHYIERGYEDIIGKLRAVGADIRRIETYEESPADAAG